MSYIDKKMCMESLRLKLGDIIQGNDIDQIITLVDDVLIDYDITAIKKDESDTSSEQIAEFYLTTLEIQGYAKGTIDGKKRYLKKLLEFTGVPYVKMRTEHIMSFMKHEKDRGISPVTIEHHRHTFNAFFDFMIREELIVKNPMKRVMPFKTADIMQIHSAIRKSGCWMREQRPTETGRSSPSSEPLGAESQRRQRSTETTLTGRTDA